MSRHRYDAEIQGPKESTIRLRRHSHHGHLHLKPAAVIDHLKRKVKHKRSDKSDSFVSSADGTSSRNINGNINHNNQKQLSQNHNESFSGLSLISDRNHSFTTPTTLPKNKSSDEHDIDANDHNNISIENDQQDVIVHKQINDDEDIEQTVQWRTNHIVSDTDQQMSPTKPKFTKATKQLSETSSQINGKKRRQTVRRTAFRIRDEDFGVIFSDLPSDEKLIIGFPCAWRKDVFVHGRMFLSVNYFSFYTCFFKWEESLSIPYADIISITREKSAKLVPNAIKIRTKTQEQYIFVSLVSREKVFIAIFRLWQNILLDQPIDYEQLRALVYADQQNLHESSGDSEESLILENTGEVASESVISSKSLPVIADLPIEPLTQPKKTQRRVVSLPPDNERTTYLSTCTCESHLSKTYADRTFAYSVDTLFEFICGDNSFNLDFHTSQKLTEYTFGEWRLDNETGKRERQITYKTIAQSILGTNTLSCREKQVLEVEIPGSIYVLSTEVYNEGMKYTDAFYVATRFCMVQRDSEHSSLRITAEIRYIKNVNGFIKTFIEKNSNSYLENGINEQVRRLESQQAPQVNRKPHSKSLPVSKQDAHKSIHNKKSHNRTEEDSLTNPIVVQEPKIAIDEWTITGKGTIYDIGIFIGICVLLLHIYLCYKLYSIDHTLLTPEFTCLNQCKKFCPEKHSH